MRHDINITTFCANTQQRRVYTLNLTTQFRRVPFNFWLVYVCVYVVCFVGYLVTEFISIISSVLDLVYCTRPDSFVTIKGSQSRMRWMRIQRTGSCRLFGFRIFGPATIKIICSFNFMVYILGQASWLRNDESDGVCDRMWAYWSIYASLNDVIIRIKYIKIP